MTQGTVWLVVICIGIVTLALRLSFILLFERMKMPSLLQRALRFVPVAVLPALIVPALSYHGGALDISLDNYRLVAGVLAAVVAWRTRNVLLTICTGMASLWIMQAVS